MPVTNYIWDELSDNVLMETDENDALVANYTCEPSQFGEVLSQHRANNDQYFNFDGLGSTRDLTGNTQTVSDSYTYSAFGETVSSSGSTTNPFQWNGAVGYYTNEETGEFYVRRRSYDPAIARWLSRDPLGFVDGPNVYLYVDNSVPGGVDPFGMDVTSVSGWQGETDPKPRLTIKFTVSSDNTCINDPEKPTNCPCKERCKGSVKLKLTFYAELDFLRTGIPESVRLVKEGANYEFKACGETNPIVHCAPNANIPFSSHTLSASITCDNELDCCGDNFSDSATIGKPNDRPVINVIWGAKVSDCGDVCFILKHPTIGPGDDFGNHVFTDPYYVNEEQLCKQPPRPSFDPLGPASENYHWGRHW